MTATEDFFPPTTSQNTPEGGEVEKMFDVIDSYSSKDAWKILITPLFLQ